MHVVAELRGVKASSSYNVRRATQSCNQTMVDSQLLCATAAAAVLVQIVVCCCKDKYSASSLHNKASDWYYLTLVQQAIGVAVAAV
jgi:hypothetical protein